MQVANSAPSRLQRNSAASGWGEWKVKLTSAVRTVPEGPLSMTVPGSVESTEKLRETAAPVLPAASRERTSKVWSPSSRPVSSVPVEQGS